MPASSAGDTGPGCGSKEIYFRYVEDSLWDRKVVGLRMHFSRIKDAREVVESLPWTGM